MPNAATRTKDAPLVRAFALVALVVGIEQAYFLGLSYLGPAGGWAALVLLPLGLLVLLWIWIRSEGRRPREFGWISYGNPARVIGIALGLFAVYLAVILETGIFFGFARSTPPSPAVGILLAVGVSVSALAQQGIFQGYFLRRLADRGHFLRGVVIAAGFSAIAVTNLSLIPSLQEVSLGEYLFTTTATAFTLALVLGVYLYKSRWSLVGPVVFGSAVLLAPYLLPIIVPSSNWELAFFAQILADSVVLLLLVGLVHEPSYLAHRYLGEQFGPKRNRFRSRAIARREARQTVVVVAILVPAIIASIFAVQAYSGTRTPVIAIASGSMEPTLTRGDLVVVQHATPSELAVGDIIAFSVSCLPSPTVHRIVSVQLTGPGAPTYQTKGDANPSPDPCTVPYSDVIGKVVATAPILGFFELYPALPIGLVALAALVPFLRESPSKRGIRPEG